MPTVDLCLSVTKFSHATSPRSEKKIPWTHITATDMFVLVKENNGVLGMQVVHATKVLESLNVGQYIDVSVSTRRDAERDGVALQIDQLPIFGMTRDSLLAVRYLVNDGQARRLQLRLQSPTECADVVRAFQSKGMEFQSHRPRTARPVTSTMYTRSASYQQKPEGGFQFPRPYTSTDEPLPLAPYSQPLEPPGLDRSHHFHPRDEVPASQERSASRHSSSSAFRSHTTSYHPGPGSLSVMPHAGEPAPERPSLTSNAAFLATIRQAVEETSDPHSPHLSPGLQAAYQKPVEQSSSSVSESVNTVLLSSDLAGRGPTTAHSITSPMPAAFAPVQYHIPPRRELPFKRPASERSSSTDRGARPGSAIALPPLLRRECAEHVNQSPIRAGPKSTARSGPPSRQTSYSLQKRNHDKSAMDNRAADDQCDPNRSPDPQRGAKVIDKGNQQMPRPPGMNQVLEKYKQNISFKPAASIMNRMGSLSDAPHEIESPPTTAPVAAARGPSDIPPATVSDAVHDSAARAHAAVNSQEKHEADFQMTQYARSSQDDRQAALEQFMLAQINDPRFTDLCKDIECCWSRIMLGL